MQTECLPLRQTAETERRMTQRWTNPARWAWARKRLAVPLARRREEAAERPRGSFRPSLTGLTGRR
eukprot:364950-Chlamydomonas_euryale.AAC.18